MPGPGIGLGGGARRDGRSASRARMDRGRTTGVFGFGMAAIGLPSGPPPRPGSRTGWTRPNGPVAPRRRAWSAAHEAKAARRAGPVRGRPDPTSRQIAEALERRQPGADALHVAPIGDQRGRRRLGRAQVDDPGLHGVGKRRGGGEPAPRCHTGDWVAGWRLTSAARLPVTAGRGRVPCLTSWSAGRPDRDRR